MLILFLTVSCNHSDMDCKPETKEYYYHTNSTICNFPYPDSISDRYFRDKDKYEKKYSMFKPFIIDGNNIVFEYIYHAKQCYSEPYYQYLVFQIPAYLDAFKVSDKNLKYLNCGFEEVSQVWEGYRQINKGTISGKRIYDSTWYIMADITAHCTDSNSTNGDIQVKFNGTFKNHNNCTNYINKKP
jgi:hypothetical protein